MLWLMDITNVVHNHTKYERALIGVFRQNVGHLSTVERVSSCDLALQELGEVGESADYILIWLREVKVVKRGAWLIKIGQVDEVPVALENETHSFDMVCERSALSEGMISFLHEVGPRLLQGNELVKSRGEHVWVVGLKE